MKTKTKTLNKTQRRLRLQSILTSESAMSSDLQQRLVWHLLGEMSVYDTDEDSVDGVFFLMLIERMEGVLPAEQP